MSKEVVPLGESSSLLYLTFKKMKTFLLAFSSNKWANFKKRGKIKFLWHTNITLIMQKTWTNHKNKTKVFILSTITTTFFKSISTKSELMCASISEANIYSISTLWRTTFKRLVRLLRVISSVSISMKFQEVVKLKFSVNVNGKFTST